MEQPVVESFLIRMWPVVGIIIVGIAVVLAIACSSVAREKGLDPNLWGVLGFFFGIFAIVILLFISRGSGKDWIQFRNEDGEVLEVRWDEHGTWAARLTTDDGERIDALTPSEVAHFQLKGKNVSEEVVSAVYARLYRIRPSRGA